VTGDWGMKRFFIAALAAATTWIGAHAPAAQAETIVAVTQVSYDAAGRQACTAVRMNPDTFTALPSDACTLATTSGTYGADRITRAILDSAGQVTEIDQAYGTTVQRAYGRYTYTKNGLKHTETDANGNLTIFDYDNFGRLQRIAYPSTTIGSGTANNSDYEYFSYDANNNKTAWRRRDGQTFNYAYDNLNRETFKDVPGGTSADVYTNYDVSGHILWRRFNSTAGTEPTVSYVYDGLGRVNSTTDMNGRTIWYGYNQASARTQLTFPDMNNIGFGLDAANRLSTIGWNATSGLLTQTYDNLGRIILQSKGGGGTGYSYDNLGRLTGLTNDFNGTTNDISWAYGYNPAGQIYNTYSASTLYDYKETVSSTDSPSYDGLNRDTRFVPVTASCPNGGYDARQNMICDNTGRRFTYDVENHLMTAIGNGANM